MGAAGAVAGLGQWLVLRHSVKRAGWWILAAALSWAATYLLAGSGSPRTVLAPGVITGTALELLLLAPVAEEASHQIPQASK